MREALKRGGNGTSSWLSADSSSISGLVRNALVIGTLALLVLLLTVDRGGGSGGSGGRAGRVEERVLPSAGDSTGNANGAVPYGAGRGKAHKVRMIHVGKTGGATTKAYMMHLNNGAKEKYTSCSDGEFQHFCRIHVTRLKKSKLIEWLRDDDVIAFVSVRDPLERMKSAYNWRKHKCDIRYEKDKYYNCSPGTCLRKCVNLHALYFHTGIDEGSRRMPCASSACSHSKSHNVF